MLMLPPITGASRHLRVRGFTLLELMVTLSLVVVLVLLAMYPLQDWMNNNRVRSTADILQNGLRQAQAEATRRSRTVMFVLTDKTTFAEVGKGPGDLEAADESAGGNRVKAAHWGIYVTERTGADAALVEVGLQDNTGRSVRITGPAAICFNSLGRLVARTNAEAGVGDAACASTGIPATYDVAMEGTDARNLRLLVGVGGRIRMCDPGKSTGLDACAP